MQDTDIRKAFKRTLQKQGLKMKLGTKVNKAENTGSSVKLWVEPAKGGKEEVLEADVVLVAAGGGARARVYNVCVGTDLYLCVWERA